MNLYSSGKFSQKHSDQEIIPVKTFPVATAGIKAIIFDCDGVLVNSEYFHLLTWQYALQKRGCDVTVEEYYSLVGKPGPEIARTLAKKIDGDCWEELLRDKRAYYYELQKKGSLPIQSTIDFVRRLANEKKTRDLSLGVASAAKKGDLLSNLRFHGIEECFDVILSGQDDLKEYLDPEGVNKPKPYIYLHAAKMLGLSPGQCVVIEDSETGVNAGVNAGCITIAVPNHFTKRQNLSHATLRVDSFAGMDVDCFLSLIADLQKEF